MKNYVNSCLMLSTSLWTGIDLSAVFKDEDIKNIERDSHITVFYTDKQVIPKDGMLDKIKTILGEDNNFLDSFRSHEMYNVLDFFELEKFENESDFLVLRLREDCDLYNNLNILETGLVSAYDIKKTFSEYKPHMTLAELESGKAKDYIFSPILGLILETAKFSVDDLLLSWGNEDKEYKHFQITSENAIDRYFRQKELDRDKDYYDNL